MTPACAMPTAFGFVMTTGPCIVPDSSIQETPVISPLPFRLKYPADKGSPGLCLPLGWMAVTPVLTLSPSIRVWQPTSTPGTSVIALCLPGVPWYFRPTARARGLPVGVVRCGAYLLLAVLTGISVTLRQGFGLPSVCLRSAGAGVNPRRDRVRHMGAEPVC